MMGIPKSIWASAICILALIILVPLGLKNNLENTLNIDSNGINQNDVTDNLKGMSDEEQAEYLEVLNSINDKTISKFDNNEYIGDKIIYETPKDINSLYILVSKKSDNINKIRDIIKEYNNESNKFNYYIIYQENESSSLTGLSIYNSIAPSKKNNLEEVPKIFLIQENKIVLSSNNYADIPIKGN